MFEDKKPKTLRFTLQRQEIRRLGVEELSLVAGGEGSAACCLNKCDTDYASTGDRTFCKGCKPATVRAGC